jgi:hypothetical protein
VILLILKALVEFRKRFGQIPEERVAFVRSVDTVKPPALGGPCLRLGELPLSALGNGRS